MERLFNKYFVSPWLRVRLLLFLLTITTTQSISATEPELWEAFNNGEVIALMRHAIAPGNGDPTEFNVNDCSTQRNLSKDGILQAQQIGLQIKANNTTQTDVYSSQWCRCYDTAINLNLGTVQKLPMLNSFYQNRSTEAAQTTQLKDWIINRLSNNTSTKNVNEPNTGPALLVTHQVNITALTGVFPSSGEIGFVGIDNSQITVLKTWLATD